MKRSLLLSLLAVAPLAAGPSARVAIGPSARVAVGPSARVAVAPFDLDVQVPPDTPLRWGRVFPAVTPRRRPGQGATTPGESGPAGAGAEARRTTSLPSRAVVESAFSSPFGLVRILTWDIYLHLPWVRSEPDPAHPATGSVAEGPPLPSPGDGLYWVCVAPLLRLLLHPQIVNEDEVLAHLLEIGEPVLGVLAAASTEKYLEEPAARLRELLPGTPTASAEIGDAGTARATMIARFVASELMSEHPYDPEGHFGMRLDALGDEVEPVLKRFARHGHPFLRRNAVSALGRRGTPAALEALARVAATTDDMVVLTRALAAIGSYRALRDTRFLLARLEVAEDRIERATLIGALGLLARSEVAPLLVTLGEAAGVDDPDLSMSVLTALARIPLPAERERVQDFLRDVREEATRAPRRFELERDHSPATADMADTKTTRGEILSQLALVAEVRLQPGEESMRKELLALLEPAANLPASALAQRGLALLNASLRRVYPPVRVVFLEALADIGEDGQAALERIALDASIDPTMRGYALGLLPWVSRAEPARAICAADSEESDEMRVHALAVLASGRHAEAIAVAREVLAECTKMPAGAGTLGQRTLCLTALEALGDRGKLEVADLLNLLRHAEAPRWSNGNAAIFVREGVVSLVQAAAAGVDRRNLEARIETLMNLVIERGWNARITEDKRDASVEYVLGQLAGVKAHAGDAPYRELVVDAVLEYVLGYEIDRPDRAAGQFAPPVPLEETILLALGATREPAAAAALAHFIGREQSTLRATACVALGNSGQAGRAAALLPLLVDGDPFVRMCAGEAMRKLTGTEVGVDWIYGEPGQHAGAVELYRQVLEGK